MAARKKVWYRAGRKYFDDLDDARAYALGMRNAYEVPITRDGKFIGDVDVFSKEWITYKSNVNVSHNGMRYAVYKTVDKKYRLNPNGSTNGRTR